MPLKTVSLLSGRILSKVRTPKESAKADPTGQAAKKPENKQEIEQSLARSQSMLPSPKLILTLENRDYMLGMKEKMAEILRFYKNANYCAVQ